MFFKEKEFDKIKINQQEYFAYYRIYKYTKKHETFFDDNLIWSNDKKSFHKYNDVFFIKLDLNITIMICTSSKKVVKVVDKESESFINFTVFDYIHFDEDSFKLSYNLNVKHVRFGNIMDTNNIDLSIMIKDEMIASSNNFIYQIDKNTESIMLNCKSKDGFSIISDHFKNFLNENKLTLLGLQGKDSQNLNLMNLEFKNKICKGFIYFNIESNIFENVSLFGKNDLKLHEEFKLNEKDFYIGIENILKDFKMYEDIQYKI